MKSNQQHRTSEGTDAKKGKVDHLILKLSNEKCNVVTEDKTVEKRVKGLSERHTWRERRCS